VQEGQRRIGARLAAGLLGVAALAAACRPEPGVPTLRWYVNPDNGGQARVAARF
jgi:multiple sugar transport system substrate-binding protein